MLSRIAKTLLVSHNNGSSIIRKFALPLGELSSQQLRNQATISLSSCKKYLVLDDGDQQLEQKQFNKSKFPLLWLRDNCTCSQCFHPEVNRRILDWSKLPFDDLALKAFKVSDSGAAVHLYWHDGHESNFKLDFFKQHKFDKQTSAEANLRYRLPKIPWSKNDADFRMPRYNFEEILRNADGKELKRWLSGFCRDGMAILENPNMENKRPELMNEFITSLFGFCKETHYGREFHIRNRLSDVTNVAYLNGNLQSHTDLPYYEYVPGVTVLHYLKQSVQGGKSTLVDGFKIAERIRAEDPEAFEVLSTVPVNWVDKGTENGLKFHKVFKEPVIGLNKDGKLDRIRFSVPQRDSTFSISDPKLVQRWYESMKMFIRFVQEELLEFKMNENDFLVFDNARLLHGRTAYDAMEDRMLVGCYLDWDEIYSKYRANEN